MRKIFFFAAFLAFAGVSNAQQKAVSAEATQVVEKKNNFDEWSEALKLTDKQIAQFKSITEKYSAEKQKIRGTGTAKDFQAINERRDKEIKGILTQEQIKLNEEYELKKEELKRTNAALKSK